MLTAQGCAARRQRLFEALPAPCDFLVVGDPSDLIYFAGYAPSPFQFQSVESSALLLLEPGRATLIADNLLGPFLEKAHADEVVAPTWYDGSRPTRPRRAQLVESTLARLAKVPGLRVGVELAAVPSGVSEGLRAARSGLEIVDITPAIRPLRRSKDADEVATLQRAMKAGEAAHAAALARMMPGMTELEAYLLVDFSVVVDGYRGDFTNTFAVGGGPTPRQRELFDACVGALKAAESRLKPGTVARDVDAAVRDHFGSLGLLDHFPTHTGHGIGLGHPEPPYFVPGSDEVLVEGDVVAVEPGLYIEGTGGMRFERNYLITAGGFETLSNHQIQIQQ